MIKSQDQNAERSYNIKIDTSSFEGMEQFNYETTLTNETCTQQEIRSSLAIIRCSAFCLLVGIQKYKVIQNFYFACCCAWV